MEQVCILFTIDPLTHPITNSGGIIPCNSFNCMLFAVWMLLHRLRSWHSINPALVQTQQPQDFESMLVYRWSTVYDVVPWFNVLCLLESVVCAGSHAVHNRPTDCHVKTALFTVVPDTNVPSEITPSRLISRYAISSRDSHIGYSDTRWMAQQVHKIPFSINM